MENRTHIGLDGRVLKDRLEELAEKTARNIRECANFCDTFLKKRLLIKVLKGPIWAEKLGGFMTMFAERKEEFQFALAMHTANTLSDVKAQNVDIQAKYVDVLYWLGIVLIAKYLRSFRLDVVIGLFGRFVSAEERKIAAEVESKGGIAKVRKDDEVLKSLIALDVSMRRGPGKASEDVEKPPTNPTTANATAATRRQVKPTTTKKSLTLEDLKIELREDIDDALEKNFEIFLGKFELQVSMLQIALERYIHLENDRVINAVTGAITQGPHTRIKDPVRFHEYVPGIAYSS